MSWNWIHRAAVLAITFCLTGAALASTDTAVITDYRALKDSIEAGERERIEALLADLEGSPLAGHAKMRVLRAHLDEVDARDVATFLKNHPDLVGRDRFRVAWMRQLAERNAWQRLDATFNGERDVHVRCAVVVARRELGRIDAALSLARELWNVGYRQPDRCNEAFELLERQGELTNTRVRNRLRLAIVAGNTGLAAAYRDRLPPSQRAVIDNWIAVYGSPDRAADLAPAALGTKGERDAVLLSAFKALARRDPRQARQAWSAVAAAHELADIAGSVEREIALQAVYEDLPNGGEWLQSLPDKHATPAVHAWRVRDALRGPDWQAVLGATKRMDTQQRSTNRWRYWRARALAATGRSRRASEQFHDVAEAFGYYGFLAADAIDAAYSSGEASPSSDDGARKEIRRLPRIERALHLHQAGDEAMAIRVWRRAIGRLEGPAARVAAARVAQNASWPWATMFASGRAGTDGASPLRFPTGFSDLVAKAAEAHDLPEAWILALIRRESAFRNTACSSAGACGLTQLMPGTGRWMLQRLGRGANDLSRTLASPEHNIPAGVAYLAHLRSRFDHPVTALAAYNAGPTNVRRWLSQSATPAGSARWIETLPFGETRDYVIAVLFNRAVYDLLANRSTRRLAALVRNDANK